MLFSALALTALTVTPSLLAKVVTGRGPGRGGGGGQGRPGPRRNGTNNGGIQGVDAKFLCPDSGLIKSWRAASQEDTDLLRQAIENGFIDGYSTKDIKDEYPRFNRFTNKCLGDKVSNLRRTFRDNVERRQQMDASGGGGQQLPARNAFQQPDAFQQRFGNDIYNENNDEDYIDESMSKMTLEEDEFSFASHSVALRSRGGVSFRSHGAPRSGTGSAAGSASPSSSENHPAGILQNGSSSSRRSSSSSSGDQYFGGSVCQYTVDRWIDTVPRKRYSIHARMNSGSQVPLYTTARVSTDQRHISISQPVSDCFMCPEQGLFYLFDRVKKAYPYIDSIAKFRDYMKTHPRSIAMFKTVKKIKARDPTLDGAVSEIRIPLSGKVSFDFVSEEEDPICFGHEFIKDPFTGETHLFVELKEEKTDGFTSPERRASGTASNIRTPGMSAIPEEVSIDTSSRSLDNGSVGGYSHRSARSARSARTTGSYRTAGTHRDMDIDLMDESITSQHSNTADHQDDEDANFDTYLERVETELLNQINGRPNENDIETSTFYSTHTGASGNQSPRKKQRSNHGDGDKTRKFRKRVPNRIPFL